MIPPTHKDVTLSLVVNKAYHEVVEMIINAVEFSFVSHMCRRTQREERRRAEKAFEIFKTLRAEARYSLERINDCLPKYLGYWLDGIEWNPSKRRSWMPGDPVVHPLSARDSRLVLRR